jgi:purine-binding chemotaxis protein CheW
MNALPTECQTQKVLGYRLGEDRFGLPAETVLRIIRAVEVTPVPGFPACAMGVINVQGQVMPVISMRRKFNLPDKPVRLSDRFIVAKAGERSVVLVADEVENLFELTPGTIAESSGILPSNQQFRGVAKLSDGLLLIHDLAGLLSLDEGELIDSTLSSPDSRTNPA